MHNIGSKAAPAHTEGNGVPTEHTFNPVSATTFQNTPAPQHTFNSFSANSFRSAPAPQWPLPNIPASYPVISKDPVTVPSDQYNSWELLNHFDALMMNLVREVYLPGYRIPAESRSRFSNTISETHRLEVVAIGITPYSTVSGTPYGIDRQGMLGQPPQPPQHTYGYGLSQQRYRPMRRLSQQRYDPMRTSLHGTQNISELPRIKRGRPRKSEARKPQRIHNEDGWETHAADDLSSAEPMGYRAEADKVEDSPKRPPRIFLSSLDFSEISPDITPPAPQPVSSTAQFTPYLENPRKAPEPPRLDVVDDLLKLWTLVR